MESAPKVVIADNIDSIVFPSGDDERPGAIHGRSVHLIESTRRNLVGDLGVPDERIYTAAKGPQGTMRIVRFLFDLKKSRAIAKDSKTLVVVPGRLSNGWGDLVKRIYRYIASNHLTSKQDIKSAASNIADVLKRIEEIREQVTSGEVLNFDVVVPRELLGRAMSLLETETILPDTADIRNEVQKMVMIVLLTNGADYLFEGRMAADPSVGLIDDALLTQTVGDNPTLLRDAVLRALDRRSPPKPAEPVVK